MFLATSIQASEPFRESHDFHVFQMHIPLQRLIDLHQLGFLFNLFLEHIQLANLQGCVLLCQQRNPPLQLSDVVLPPFPARRRTLPVPLSTHSLPLILIFLHVRARPRACTNILTFPFLLSLCAKQLSRRELDMWRRP